MHTIHAAIFTVLMSNFDATREIIGHTNSISTVPRTANATTDRTHTNPPILPVVQRPADRKLQDSGNEAADDWDEYRPACESVRTEIGKQPTAAIDVQQ